MFSLLNWSNKLLFEFSANYISNETLYAKIDNTKTSIFLNFKTIHAYHMYCLTGLDNKG